MKRTDMGILNELSEFIALRMKSFWELDHDGNWLEHKAHIEYDLWFVQSGNIKITIDGIEHTANPGDVLFFYPEVPYMAATTDEGCRFTFIHFDFGMNGRKTKKSERSLDVLQPVFTYVTDHLHQSIKMNELAALVGLSEKYFISYFKKALGITPGQYIYQIKMNLAREYLYEKKHMVQQIAGFLGYPDAFTFSKAFKKYYNVPPSKFE